MAGALSAAARQDVLGGVASMAGALAVLAAVQSLRHSGKISSLLARKLMHIGAGLGFVATWPLYSGTSWRARLMAVAAPTLVTLRFVAAGLCILPSPRLVASATREGRPEELLYGPSIYGVVIAALTLTHFRTPAGVVAVAALCGGDGLADVAGRRYGHLLGPLPHNGRKTWVGSLACAAGAFAAALPELLLLRAAGCLEGPPLSLARTVGGCALCGVAAAAVETLPFKEVDNLTVPLAVLAAAGPAFGGQG